MRTFGDDLDVLAVTPQTNVQSIQVEEVQVDDLQDVNDCKSLLRDIKETLQRIHIDFIILNWL